MGDEKRVPILKVGPDLHPSGGHYPALGPVSVIVNAWPSALDAIQSTRQPCWFPKIRRLADRNWLISKDYAEYSIVRESIQTLNY